MQTGKIKALSERGFGFVINDNDASELFFHAKNCNTPFDDLTSGQLVRFEISTGERGPCAVSVERL